MLRFVFVLGLLAGLADAEPTAPYQNARVVRVVVDSPKMLLALSQIAEPLACVPGPGPNDFLVLEEHLEAFEALDIAHVVRTENAQAWLDEEAALNDAARSERGAGFFSAYRTIGEIWTHLDGLAQQDEGAGSPGHLVEVFSVGDSIQGRPIRGLRITTPSTPGAPPKPVFLITACQHAREWIAASSAMWIADHLSTQYGSDPIVTDLLNNVDFRIIPVVNPDGYNHTFPTAQGGGNSRLWRKNRRLNSGGSFGVDLNRNWSVGWGGSGSSSSQSSDIYRGSAAFSEPETAAVRDYALGIPSLKGHIDLHSYSQLVLAPWGYTTSAPPRLSEVAPLTSAQIDAISDVNGAFFSGGQASTALYVASGTTPDWSFGTTGALAWTYELRDTGALGFVLPPDQIIPSATEAFGGIRVLAEHIQIRLRISASGVPTSLTTGSAATFGVSITTENQYTHASGSAVLKWRVSGGAEQSTPLSGGPTDFLAEIPGQGCGATIEFAIEATANDGLVVRLPEAGFFTASTAACPGCLGDANGDRQIEFTDISTILATWGNVGVAPMIGDSNFNGSVGFDDITTTLGRWGFACQP